MPEDIKEPVRPELPSLEGMIAKMTAKQLKKKAEEQFLNLLKQGRHIISMQSNLDILMKRYHVGKSYLSSVVDWYGNMSWWTQLWTSITFVAASALIGAVFNLGALCALLSIGIYYAASFFLLNHYDTTSFRDKRFCDDIVEMEKTLGSSIEALNILGDNLKDVFVSLANEQCVLSEESVNFEEQITVLSQQVLHFMETVNHLGSTEDGLLKAHDALNNAAQYVREDLKMVYENFLDKSVVLVNLGKKLAKAHISIVDSTVNIAGIDEKITKNLHALSLLEEGIQAQLVILEASVNEDNNRREDMTAELRLLVNTRLESSKNTDAIIASAGECILDTDLALEAYDRRMQTMDIEDQKIDAEIARQHKENREQLSHLEALLETCPGSRAFSFG